MRWNCRLAAAGTAAHTLAQAAVPAAAKHVALHLRKRLVGFVLFDKFRGLEHSGHVVERL